MITFLVLAWVSIGYYEWLRSMRHVARCMGVYPGWVEFLTVLFILAVLLLIGPGVYLLILGLKWFGPFQIGTYTVTYHA